ncbi:helix-turn-helix domain-containing protein [Vibrio casei]|uniref:MerR family transcriptional regulator n=1 Tax=Vibrio casei TaxID=673372 RepID=A0A368LJG2_9VIBR|nr:helix-turn-helix domain-containing protein [Vibrio casei]RCS70811.1 MerR family transcriptional regulator [Vibrio casei]
MDIGEVAKRSGCLPSTLRYYEKLGLIHSVGRHGLRRQYTSKVLNKLSIISLGQMAGLSLTEIATMFDEHQELVIDRVLLLEKTQQIDEQIRHLKAVKKSLHHVATCPQLSHLECPSFQKMMEAVQKI